MSQNLCVKIPESIGYDEVAFSVVSAVAMQGIRLAQPMLGECFVVTGLGLLGLVTVQLLRAHGCRVLGIDPDGEKLALAKQFGAVLVNISAGEDPVAVAQAFSRGYGVDGVIVCAGGKSSEMINQAADMCRVRGRVIQIGVTGLDLNREKFFRKEIQLQVSNSTGPGKSDPVYENQGIDYPIGFVRWTEKRNIEAVLDMMADGRLDVKPLISHRFPIDEAAKAYEVVGGSEPSLGILLEYPGIEITPESRTVVLGPHPQPLSQGERGAKVQPLSQQERGDKAVVSFVGAGNYASAVLIPAFKEAGARLKTVASNGGVSGTHAGRKYGFELSTTATDEVFSDPEINSVVITTRHNSHAGLVCNALEAGKNVFVEKPLALSDEELDRIESAYRHACEQSKAPLLMVGFNRRFSPQVQKIKGLLESAKTPKSFVMTVNAGAIPAEHWTQDREVGGGRIIGEACHFLDLLRFLAGSPINGHQAVFMGSAPGIDVHDDKVSFALKFEDGSFGTVHYLANGHKSYPKERLEVFCAGGVLQLDNFRRLRGYGWPGFRKMNLWRQDKGQKACAAAFVRAVEQGGAAPIPFQEIMEVSRVTIDIASGAN
ncbi:MAG: bi-domain-containing oxidoreductase [Pseudomonadota bacterium]